MHLLMMESDVETTVECFLCIPDDLKGLKSIKVAFLTKMLRFFRNQLQDRYKENVSFVEFVLVLNLVLFVSMSPRSFKMVGKLS